MTSNSYHAPVVPVTVLVASAGEPAGGALLNVMPFSVQVVLATGKTPTGRLDASVLSRLPNSRSLAEVMSLAAPTPVRSNRMNVWRRYPAVAEFLTSSRVDWPKFWLAELPSRTSASATSDSVTVGVGGGRRGRGAGDGRAARPARGRAGADRLDGDQGRVVAGGGVGVRAVHGERAGAGLDHGAVARGGAVAPVDGRGVVGGARRHVRARERRDVHVVIAAPGLPLIALPVTLMTSEPTNAVEVTTVLGAWSWKIVVVIVGLPMAAYV